MKNRSRLSAARTVLGLGLGGFCLWLAFRSVPFDEVGRVLASARLAPLVAGVAAILGATLFRAWRWQLLFPLGDRAVRFRNLWPIIVVGQMVNILVPARAGEVVRLYLIRREEHRAVTETLGTVAVEKALDAVAFLAMLGVLLLWMDLPGGLKQAGTALSVTLGIAALAVGIAAALGDRAVRAIERSRVLPARFRQPVVRRWLRPLADGFAGRRRVEGLVAALALSFFAWGAGWLANYSCLVALGIDQAALAALVVLVVLQLGTAVPVSPGGIGVFEYLCVLALGVFAVPRTVAVSYGVVLHAVAYAPPMVLGAGFMFTRAIPWKAGLLAPLDAPQSGAAVGPKR